MWMRERLGARQARFVDHSGLGVDSKLRPHDMTRALVAAGPNGMLRGLMRDIPVLNDAGNRMPYSPLEVVAKTGTLNFVSTLAGYVRTPNGRSLAFSVFCADLERRARLTHDQMERPPGGRTYNGRAKRLQQALVRRWGGALRLERHVPRARPALDGGGMQAVDIERVAQFLEEPQFLLPQRAVGGGHVAGRWHRRFPTGVLAGASCTSPKSASSPSSSSKSSNTVCATARVRSAS